MMNDLKPNDFSPFDISPEPAVPVVKHKSLISHGITGANAPPDITEESLMAALEKRRTGRMSSFTEEIGLEILEGLQDGRTFQKIADGLGIGRSQIWFWMQSIPAFSSAVARAREYQAHSYSDDAVNIVDDVDISDPSLDPRLISAAIRKSELKARFRTDLAKAYNPGQYAERKQITAEITVESPDQRIQRLTGAALTIPAECVHLIE